MVYIYLIAKLFYFSVGRKHGVSQDGSERLQWTRNGTSERQKRIEKSCKRKRDGTSRWSSDNKDGNI